VSFAVLAHGTVERARDDGDDYGCSDGERDKADAGTAARCPSTCFLDQ